MELIKISKIKKRIMLSIVVIGSVIVSSSIVSSIAKERDYTTLENAYDYRIGSIEEINKLIEQEEKRQEEIEYQKLEKQRLAEKNRLRVPSRGKKLSVPNNDTSFKSYMPYTKVTNKSSNQYKALYHKKPNGELGRYIDSRGMVRYKLGNEKNEENDAYFVALGSYYGYGGDMAIINLPNHSIIGILGDCKADGDTDSTNRQHKSDNSVVEFLVSKGYKGKHFQMGNISYLTYDWSSEDIFQGRILSIERLNMNILDN